MNASLPHTRTLQGGRNLYGYAIGILMIEGRFPRPPGAIGNATTFPFPVMHHVVPGASGVRTVRELSNARSGERLRLADAIRPWIDGANWLVAQGCRAITTSCGFAALFQRQLAAAVDAPVFASSLMLAPFIARMLKPNQRVGIITADADNLTSAHWAGAGVDPATVAVIRNERLPRIRSDILARSRNARCYSVGSRNGGCGPAPSHQEPIHRRHSPRVLSPAALCGSSAVRHATASIRFYASCRHGS